VASSCLPSDCPLLNHVLLSYQKHHAPSNSAIPESQSQSEQVQIVHPIYGIDQCKFNPAITVVRDVDVKLSPHLVEPARHAMRKIAQQHLMAGDPPSDQEGQQAPRRTKNLLKIKKILKVERIIKQLCQEIKVDKTTVMQMLMQEANKSK